MANGSEEGRMAAIMDEALDFSKPLNVSAFDSLCAVMTTNPALVVAAQAQLTRFQQHPQAFLRADSILEQSSDVTARFVALQCLDRAVLHQWHALGRNQCEAIRGFVVGFIIDLCSDEAKMNANKAVLAKANATLVSVATREWPQHWPSFVQELVSSCGDGGTMLAFNNLAILRHLIEDLFECAEAKKMTSRWVERRREALLADLERIGTACVTVLQANRSPATSQRALQCLERFIPIFGPRAISEPMLGVLTASMTQFPALAYRCMAAVAELPSTGVAGAAEGNMLETLFFTAVQSALQWLPAAPAGPVDELDNMASAIGRAQRAALFRANGGAGNFSAELAGAVTDVPVRTANVLTAGFAQQEAFDAVLHFVTTFLRHRMGCLRSGMSREFLILGHQLVEGGLRSPAKGVFKMCVAYCWWLGDWLVRQPRASAGTAGQAKDLLQASAVLAGLRLQLVRHMAKPEEVIVVQDSSGEVYREQMKDVEGVELYVEMRETLVFFTALQQRDTEDLMLKLMARQVDQSEWSPRALNRISWAFGAISGAFPPDAERGLLISMVRDLLSMCSEMRGKNNRALIASDIMYVVGQYPRFLCSHARFLSTLVRKLFEFMRESFPGVKDMAVETFLKINRQCAHVYWDPKCNGFAVEILNNVHATIAELSAPQVQVYFEAMGFVVRHAPPPQSQALMQLLQGPNEAWLPMANASAQGDISALCTVDSVRSALAVLRPVARVAKTCGGVFIEEMRVFFNPCIAMYKAFSAALHAHVTAASPDPTLRNLLSAVRRELLRIVEYFVASTDDAQFVAQQCVPQILAVALEDYSSGPAASRDAQVLATVTAAVLTLGRDVAAGTAHILNHTFDATAELIVADAVQHPEHRVELFKMLDALTQHCFPELLGFVRQRPDVFRGLMWAAKHVHPETTIAGLSCLRRFCFAARTRPDICVAVATVGPDAGANPALTPEDGAAAGGVGADAVLAPLLAELVTETLVAMLDSLHQGVFAEQVALLLELFAISVAASSSAASQGSVSSGVMGHVLAAELQKIPTLSEGYPVQLLMACFQLAADLDGAGLKARLADFLVEAKVWGAEQEQKVAGAGEGAERQAQIAGLARPEAVVVALGEED